MISRLRNRATLQKTAVRLALAGTLGIGSMLATESWRGHGAADAAVPMAEVLVTARALEAGSRLAAEDLVAHRWPVAAIDGSWVGPGRDGAGGLIGQITVARLAAGTPISRAMVLDAGSSFAAGLRPGRRAISIAVSPAGGLAGFLAPGDHVDVLLTQTLGKRRIVQTLVTDLPVLGVDQRGRGALPARGTAARDGDDAATVAAPGEDGDAFADALDATAAPPGLVTLDVSPRQAEALAMAVELGSLSLVLRGPGAREPQAGDRPASRRWDSDVTGLPASVLAAGDQIVAAAAAVASAPTAPAATTATTATAAAPAGGIQITYGLQPEAAGPPK